MKKLPPYPLSTSGSPPNPSYINSWYELLRNILNGIPDGALTGEHNDLSGLQGGTTGEYYHLSSARYTSLTGGGNSTDHYHSSDRARANHTGFQKSATVNDPIAFGAVGDGVADDTSALNTMLGTLTSVNWGDNNYKITSTLTGFHNAVHTGNGSITRGSNVFYINPKLAQTNNLYVSTTGSDSNDGFTSAAPLATIQKAWDIISEWAPCLPGRWVVNVAAGTYTETLVFNSATRSEYPITITGPVVAHPSVPTAIIQPASSSDTIVTFSEGRGWFIFQYIKLDGATTGTAMVLNGGVVVSTQNMHVTGCLKAVTSQHNSKFSPVGGIWTGRGDGVAGGIGLTSQYAATHSFTGTGSSDGVQITDYERGMLINEGAQGHLDGAQISTCDQGIVFRRGAGACNTSDVAIDDCAIGIVADEPWFNNGITFGATTPNTLDVQSRGNAPEFDFCNQDYATRTERLIESEYGISHTGTTSETQVYEFDSIRAWMIGEGGHTARICMAFNQTALVGTCAIRVYMYDGSTEDLLSNITLPIGTEDAFIEARIHFSASNAQRFIAHGSYRTAGGSGALCGTYGTGAIVTKYTETWIRVKLTLSNSADTASIKWLETYGTFGG